MNDVEKYLEGLNFVQKNELQKIREIIREIVPDATETISYGMPVFKYKTKYLIGYCGFKNHMSIFPGSEAVEALQDKLKDYKTSKGTIQFTHEKPLSKDLVTEVIEYCKNRIDRGA